MTFATDAFRVGSNYTVPLAKKIEQFSLLFQEDNRVGLRT
jgi:hypothetical protein